MMEDPTLTDLSIDDNKLGADGQQESGRTNFCVTAPASSAQAMWVALAALTAANFGTTVASGQGAACPAGSSLRRSPAFKGACVRMYERERERVREERHPPGGPASLH